MGTLLLRSLGLLALFQLLGVTVLVAGRRRRALLVAGLLLAAIAGLTVALQDAEAGVFLASGVLAAAGVERAVRAGRSLWPVVFAGAVPVVLAAGFGLSNPNPQQAWSNLAAQVDSLAGVAHLPPPSGSQPPPEERRSREETERLAMAASQWALRLLPAEVLMMALLQTLPLVVVAGRLRQRDGGIAAVLPVSHWQVPFAVVWVLAVGLGLLATRSPVARIAGANLVFVVAVGLAVQGLAVLWSWLERGLPPPARALLLGSLVLAAWPFLVGALAVLGTADLWVDFRRLRPVTEDS
jgi:hypothetical protein